MFVRQVHEFFSVYTRTVLFVNHLFYPAPKDEPSPRRTVTIKTSYTTGSHRLKQDR